jgi:hypothetical protein
MNGHRQAAVSLYGLASSDQERILAELPAQDQRILVDYLAELAALGFDKAATVADTAGPLPVAQAAAPLEPGARLHGAAAADVLAGIAHEPAALIAQLLAIDSWPWADAVLDSLPPHKRKLVRDALDAGIPEAPARTRFLLDAVIAGLPQTPTARSRLRTRPIAPTLSKWLPWIR